MTHPGAPTDDAVDPVDPVDLADRYGTAPTWRRPVLLATIGVVAATFLGWVAWVAWDVGTPDVTSELISYRDVTEHSVTAVVNVSLGEGVEATCKLRAMSEDHNTVGEWTFTPVDGRNEVTIRTERRANSVESVGCTTTDQRRPR